MSKKSKAMRRRGVGRKLDVFSHHRIPTAANYAPAANAAFTPIEKGVAPGEVMGVVAHSDNGVSRVRQLDARGYPLDMNDADIGIHRNEGP